MTTSMGAMRLLLPFLGLALLGPVGRSAEPPPTAASAQDGFVPTDERGRPLNLGFEDGTLRDWSAEGDAFQGQPIKGDTVHPRRGDMHSRHAGAYWIGGYELRQDAPQGTLRSRPFKVTKPYARFLVAGGPHPETRVELVRQDTQEVLFRTSGDETEELKPVAVDLRPHLGREIFIRLVDRHSGPWGHLNFDDFRLFDVRPAAPSRPGTAPPDAFAHDGLPPEQAARAMTVPDGFRVSLFAGEPDVVQPIAMAFDDRGRLWVAEAYSYPHRVPQDQARDRILIFEDRDGDGRFDDRKVFTDKLNLVSGLEVGFGGVWVGAAPYLLFIPDKDADDRPDGPPQVLLDGWGDQDTHETLNSFAWGPDGWLYGCHGVFTHSRVGKPGTPDAQRVPINAGIWRYHPTRHAFEVFAWGTSNPWGVDFDEHGQAFLTACVIPHLYHVIQGARYERQAGEHFNPYTYEVITTIADHRHYVGANPHGGNGRSDSMGGGHAHAGAMIYLGGAWPETYRGSLFMNNIHGARLNRDVLEPKGSGFVGHHAPDFLLANDRWSQVVSLKYGPDGQVVMIDWYDKNQCHNGNENVHDRTNGRIFKISYGSAAPARLDLAKRTGLELVETLKDPNEWRVRHALRRLQELGPDPRVHQALGASLRSDRSEHARLRALWALHDTGGLDGAAIAPALKDESPNVRGWAVRLAADGGKASAPEVLAAYRELARADSSPIVRLALDSALQRLPLDDRWAIVEALLAHSEDAGDPNLPLMAWYAAEPLAERDPARALALAEGSSLARVRALLLRRIAALGSPQAIASLVGALARLNQPEAQLTLLQEVNTALKGRRQVAMPAGWPAVFERLAASGDPRVRSQGLALGLTFGDASARKALRTVLADAKGDPAARREALQALVKAHDSDLPPTLQTILAEPGLRREALRALAGFDDRRTPEVVLEAYPRLNPDERRDALNTLAGRVDYARALLGAVGSERVPSKDLSADLVRQLRNLRDPSLDATLAKVWGTVRETKADKLKLIADYKAKLSGKPERAPDPALGRAMFMKTCQQCHMLFGVGGKVGPDLTGSNRADLDYLLGNVLDPSALIGKDYQAHVISTNDGRVLTGIIRTEDRDALTLQSANDVVTIPKTEIDERRLSEQSMMPDDLWKPLSDHEVRSLVAYLASPAQVPALATPENVLGFFNGRDLAGWVGDPTLWKVEGGEIVGKTTGLAHNNFLRSELLAEDFRLTLEVKLVRNEGNSGVQFRSEPLPNGEMKGDQADIGPGWWGKLYEESGRGLLWHKSGESFIKPGDWNTYEIVAVGSRVQTFLNGHRCVDLDDPPGARRGIFAFQLHSGGPTEVRFRNLRLELPSKRQAP